MNNELRQKMQTLCDYAKAKGADQSDIILSKGESFSLSAQNNAIDKYKVSGSQVMGIRVIKDEKVGISYTESLDDDSLKATAKYAVENADNSEKNIHEKICVEGVEEIHPSEFAKDDTTTEEKIDFCLRLESEVKKKDSLVAAVPYNAFGEAKSEFYYLNSLNTFSYESEYYQSCYTSALLKNEIDSGMHYHSSIGRSFKDLDLDLCVNESIEHARAWLEAKPVKTGFYDIVFTTDALSEVMGCFSTIYSGKTAMDKTNPFREKLNQRVMGESLTIKDVPKYKNAFSKSYTDAEGHTHKDLTLIEDGILKSFYHNTVTADFFETETTCHASRGARSPLSVGGTTRVISTGTISEDEIKKDMFFEIHSLQGLHSGANAISGDFSFAATGYLYENGRRTQSVKGVTVSGNYYKMILDIKLLGDKMKSTSEKSFFSPLIRFEKVSVAGI